VSWAKLAGEEFLETPAKGKKHNPSLMQRVGIGQQSASFNLSLAVKVAFSFLGNL